MAPAALALALAFVQMLAWRYVEVPLVGAAAGLVAAAAGTWIPAQAPGVVCWGLILVAVIGAGLSLWWVWPEASLY